MGKNLHGELERALDTAAQARRLFPRGGYAGLEPHRLQVLLALCAEPDRTVGEISERLALDRTTVSHALTALRELGLITRPAQQDDRRVRRQRPTAKGRRLSSRYLQLLGSGGPVEP
jgi:DNA-binding MarR family transcriptional regulator